MSTFWDQFLGDAIQVQIWIKKNRRETSLDADIKVQVQNYLNFDINVLTSLLFLERHQSSIDQLPNKFPNYFHTGLISNRKYVWSLLVNVTFYRKRSTLQNDWRQSSGTKVPELWRQTFCKVLLFLWNVTFFWIFAAWLGKQCNRKLLPWFDFPAFLIQLLCILINNHY